MMRTASLSLASAALLSGCVAGPDHARPEPPVSEALEQGRFLRAAEIDASAPVARWWEAMDDTVLSGLIELGLQEAPAIEAVRARVRQARAGVSASRAALLPGLSSSATYVYADLPNQAFGTGAGANEFFTLGFDAQWEIDLWGGKARVLERARANAATAEAMLADAQVGLSAEIARSYVALQARQASENLLRDRKHIDARMILFAQKRLDGGTGTRQELAGAQQRYAQTEAEMAAMQAEVAVLRDALAVLTGDAPGAFDRLPRTAIPLPPAQVRIGDPAAMLARRPDVIAAEKKLAAASASIGEAQARRLPGISLIGLVGIGGTSIGDVFDTSQLSALTVPRLTWNFLDFGRAAAAVRGAKAGRDAALAEYRASVLGALQDAEASLARFGAARIALAQAGGTLLASQDTERLQKLRAEAGAASEAEALEAERQAIDARLAEINSRASLTLAYVALTKSLGLGWQTADEPES